MASQYGEDVFILEYFRKQDENAVHRFTSAPRRFLDVGAYNGVEHSNTLALLDVAWEGTYVEPSAAPFASLLELLGKREPSPTFIHAALHPVGGVIPWWDSKGDELSSYKPAHTWLFPHISFTPTLVCAITWDQLLNAVPGPYDFVNLDVEGNNCELFRIAPLERLGAELICVEYDPAHEDVFSMLSYAATHGYREYMRVGGNLLLQKEKECH